MTDILNNTNLVVTDITDATSSFVAAGLEFDCSNFYTQDLGDGHELAEISLLANSDVAGVAPEGVIVTIEWDMTISFEDVVVESYITSGASAPNKQVFKASDAGSVGQQGSFSFTRSNSEGFTFEATQELLFRVWLRHSWFGDFENGSLTITQVDVTEPEVYFWTNLVTASEREL